MSPFFQDSSSMNLLTLSSFEVSLIFDPFFSNRFALPFLLRKLKGQFSFVVSDAKTERFMAARDPIGVCPLYYGNDNTGGLWFASEMKVFFFIFQPKFLPFLLSYFFLYIVFGRCLSFLQSFSPGKLFAKRGGSSKTAIDSILSARMVRRKIYPKISRFVVLCLLILRLQFEE